MAPAPSPVLMNGSSVFLAMAMISCAHEGTSGMLHQRCNCSAAFATDHIWVGTHLTDALVLITFKWLGLPVVHGIEVTYRKAIQVAVARRQHDVTAFRLESD